MVDKAFDKAKKTFASLKHIVVLSVAFFVVICGLRLVQLRRFSRFLAFSVSKMIELELTSLEGRVGKSVDYFDSMKARLKRPIPIEAKFSTLTEFMRVEKNLDEMYWVGGDGKSRFGFVRSDGSILPQSGPGAFKGEAVFNSHNKGVVVITPISYGGKEVPYFHMGYPLDGNEGGFILARVNLWEFLKPPIEVSKQLLGSGFDLVLFDNQGKVLAHKTSQDALSQFVTGIFRSNQELGRLGIRIEVLPNRQGVLQTLNVKKMALVAFGIAAALVILV